MRRQKKGHPGFQKITQALHNVTMADVAYELEADLKGGMSSKALREKYAARLTAKQIMIGLTAEGDQIGEAIRAIRDISDRAEGRPVEKQSITHNLEKLPDEQLEALLRTELADLENVH